MRISVFSNSFLHGKWLLLSCCCPNMIEGLGLILVSKRLSTNSVPLSIYVFGFLKTISALIKKLVLERLDSAFIHLGSRKQVLRIAVSPLYLVFQFPQFVSIYASLRFKNHGNDHYLSTLLMFFEFCIEKVYLTRWRGTAFERD